MIVISWVAGSVPSPASLDPSSLLTWPAVLACLALAGLIVGPRLSTHKAGATDKPLNTEINKRKPEIRTRNALEMSPK